ASDGANSATRAAFAGSFRPEIDQRRCKYIWLSTDLVFDAFKFYIVDTPHGVLQVHGYPYDATGSTFIVEMHEDVWARAGFAGLAPASLAPGQSDDASIARIRELLAGILGGHSIEANNSKWISFGTLRCASWRHGNVVLLGDAAHTAHFSIGSGTKLAMEDAIALARILDREGDLRTALEAYQEERRTDAVRLQNAARNSMEWFENVRRYVHLPPEQFAYSLLTRSQRVGHESLRLRDRAYLEGVERWFASRASEREPERPVPPMFTPFRVRGMELANRVVVAPMDMYSAVEGPPNDFHLVHLGARALGGAGLVVTEMTCVSPEGRISLGCTGMYTVQHMAAWGRITDFVHAWTRSKLCLQLGHSGRKGSTKRMWEGMDQPLEEGGWEVLGPSDLPWAPGNPVPRPMTRGDMDRVRDEHVRATEMAVEAGFDMVELHCAHGYLLSSFISPLSNRRTDEYGGTLENRLRYPLEVFRAMRAAWPEERPMSVRISASDWVEGGIDGGDAVEVARAFHAAGADLIHVSAGQTSTEAKPVYGRMFQTPFSDRIRNEARVPTIAVGNITEPDQVNAIIAAGRADLCALARPHLTDPQWTLRAAAELGYADAPWPVQYASGRQQLERQLQRRAQELAGGGI
ncbi:MAG TPA: FAD-dependent monooxygenase, partial [Longimicrobium sp.]|nr:FAD-dependent monooxygenase [Longimicrobium sp.]